MTLIARKRMPRQATADISPGPAMIHFCAPWSKSLAVASAFATLACLGVSYVLWTTLVDASLEPLRFWLALLPLAIILICALFTVRGYAIANHALLVERLFWRTLVPLDGLKSAAFDPDATRWSIRTFGNGGFFSFTGYFRNQKLGPYRAFMTDRRRAVVLRFLDRVIVVSPDRPEDFVNVIFQYTGKS
jgi:PH (Pleckstrin Homology) domain-containing protein